MAKKHLSAADENSSPAVSFKNEVILWAVLAVAIILFISNFGIAGKAGKFISGIFFGLFGFTAYLFPVLLFAGTAFIIANKDNKIAVIKFAASIGFFVFVCMFLELIGGDSGAKSPLDSYLWSAEHKSGGGLVGGILTWLIRPNLGLISAYVIDIIMLIICMVLITQRSLWKPIQSGSKRMYASAKNETLRQHQQYTQRRQRRIDNKVTGVSTDTSIKEAKKIQPSDNINEIRPDSVFVQDFPIHMMDHPGAAAKQEIQPVQAADGLDDKINDADVMLFPVNMNSAPDETEETEIGADTEGFDNVIPIKGKKVVLQPNQTLEIEPEEDILAKTNDLFAELLSGEDLKETHSQIDRNNGTTDTETMEIGTSAQEEREHQTDLDKTDQDNIDQDKIDQHQTDLANIDQHKIDQDNIDLANIDLNQTDYLESVTGPMELQQPQEDHLPNRNMTAQPLHRNPKQSQEEIASNVTDIDVQLHQQIQPAVKREYILPPVDLLKYGDPNQTGDSRQHLQETALKLQQTLKNFGVNVTILNVSCGPSVTRYEIQPEMGVKVSKIVNLADDIKLNLAAADIRIEAPIPGKAAIGIEVPNKENVPVMFRDLIESEEFQKQTSPCAFAAGKDIAGQVVVTDICKMPHLLIAGATGSGKSVCINTIIMSIIYKANPEDVKLIMVDPKVVELSVYNGIPHLLLPVVTDPKKAAGALHWAVSEMMDRYQKFADYGVRDMKGYNAKIKKIADIPDENKPQKMPYIVIIVDELADLMMAAPGDVEDAICRLAQLARAAGIHLIIATQRPSVNVITGLIKANMPSRIAFSVTSGIDSRTILDMNGAEKLLGKGDMLFYPQGYQKPVRVQGAFVSDSEVSDVVEFLTQQNGASSYSSEIEQKVSNAASGAGGSAADVAQGEERDVYFADAAKLLIDKDKASVSMLQRYFKIGFNRAARIMDQLEEAGVVGPEEGTKPRKILMSPEEFAQYEEEVL